jgi:uncharacterized membrane protein (DUF4010 family)
MLAATQLAVNFLGRAGVNALAAIMGVTDVDPFITGMTQAAGTLAPLRVAAAAVTIAAASNNLMKGIYAYCLLPIAYCLLPIAYCLADRRTGVAALSFLAGLAAIGLLPLLWPCESQRAESQHYSDKTEHDPEEAAPS